MFVILAENGDLSSGKKKKKKKNKEGDESMQEAEGKCLNQVHFNNLDIE